MANKAGSVKWNPKGFEDVRRSPEVARLIESEVDKVVGKVYDSDFGDGDYAHGVEHGRSRLRGFVVAASFAAIYRESTEKSLLRALGGG